MKEGKGHCYKLGCVKLDKGKRPYKQCDNLKQRKDGGWLPMKAKPCGIDREVRRKERELNGRIRSGGGCWGGAQTYLRRRKNAAIIGKITSWMLVRVSDRRRRERLVVVGNTMSLLNGIILLLLLK